MPGPRQTNGPTAHKWVAPREWVGCAGLKAALSKGCSVLDCELHSNIVKETQMFAIVDFFQKLCTDQHVQ
jgi:hypothetical protein